LLPLAVLPRAPQVALGGPAQPNEDLRWCAS